MSNYRLIEKAQSKVNLFKVTIVADSNDGDYITEIDYFSQEEFEKIVSELINLRDNYGEPHQLENYPNPLDLSIPYNDFDGFCHTLEELIVEFIDENGKVWDVEF